LGLKNERNGKSGLVFRNIHASFFLAGLLAQNLALTYVPIAGFGRLSFVAPT
jgi:hypothetical protein